jgi:hypothetical protein
MNRTCLALLLIAAAALGREPEFAEHQAVQDSMKPDC